MKTHPTIPPSANENYEQVMRRIPEKKIMSLHRAMRSNYKNIFYLLCLIAASIFFFIFPNIFFGQGMMATIHESSNGIFENVCTICGRIVVVLVALEFFWILIWSYQRRYHLTDQRLVIINGIIARVKQQVCLVRVKDINMYQTFVQRFLDVGTIEIKSSDDTIGYLKIEHVGHPELFYEQLYNTWQFAVQKKGLIWW